MRALPLLAVLAPACDDGGGGGATGSAPQVIRGQPGLNGVWVDADGGTTVVGLRGVLGHLGPDGALEREESATTTLLHGIWGDGAGYRVAVGGTLDRSPPWIGVAVESGP